MSESEPGPIDVDVNELDPPELVRMLISRATSGDDLAWAEILWDSTRYNRSPQLTMHLVSFVEQLLTGLAAAQGKTSAQLWQEWMLREASPPRS